MPKSHNKKCHQYEWKVFKIPLLENSESIEIEKYIYYFKQK